MNVQYCHSAAIVIASFPRIIPTLPRVEVCRDSHVVSRSDLHTCAELLTAFPQPVSFLRL